MQPGMRMLARTLAAGQGGDAKRDAEPGGEAQRARCQRAWHALAQRQQAHQHACFGTADKRSGGAQPTSALEGLTSPGCWRFEAGLE